MKLIPVILEIDRRLFSYLIYFAFLDANSGYSSCPDDQERTTFSCAALHRTGTKEWRDLKLS